MASGLFWTRQPDGAHVAGGPVCGFAAAAGPQVVPLRATYTPPGTDDVDAVGFPRLLEDMDDDLDGLEAGPYSRGGGVLHAASGASAAGRHRPAARGALLR